MTRVPLFVIETVPWAGCVTLVMVNVSAGSGANRSLASTLNTLGVFLNPTNVSAVAVGGSLTLERLIVTVPVPVNGGRPLSSTLTVSANVGLTSKLIAAEHGLAIIAAGTHPTADWGGAQQSEGARYDAVMDDLQMIGQRNMLCGMHVHVELPDPDSRVDVMMRMLPYLPLFVAHRPQHRT